MARYLQFAVLGVELGQMWNGRGPFKVPGFLPAIFLEPTEQLPAVRRFGLFVCLISDAESSPGATPALLELRGPGITVTEPFPWRMGAGLLQIGGGPVELRFDGEDEYWYDVLVDGQVITRLRLVVDRRVHEPDEETSRN